MATPIEGFSKLTKEEKINWLVTHYAHDPEAARKTLTAYWNPDQKVQELHDEFIENTLTNFYLPWGIAPNFLINDTLYAIPMAIEESSVVAAASKAAKFWLRRGGFRTQILGTEKVGQVHFIFKGERAKLTSFFTTIKPRILSHAAPITQNMQKRGGGVTGIELVDKTDALPGYHQLHCTFETVDAMGANFINSCLEDFAQTLKREAETYPEFTPDERQIEVVMAILSNNVPNCFVRAEVRCPIAELTENKTISGEVFAQKMCLAVDIANVEPFRAVTHNKGIMNGIDAVVLASGNDFRAIEAGAHAYASKDGAYSSLTHASVKNGIFTFWLEIPLAMGTVGGLTKLHPLVQLTHEILQRPSAQELMQITAAVGLAQNFAALQSLVTTGIQQGHMKMHLLNILNQLGANEAEKKQLVGYFKTRTVTHNAVTQAFEALRN